MRVLAVVVIPVAIWFALVIALLAVPLPAPFPGPFAPERSKVLAPLTGLAGIAYLFFLIAFLIGELDAAGRRLDAAVAPLGLVSSPRLPGGRAYAGEVGGRRVSLSSVPAAGLQRAMVTAEAAARVGARVSAGWTTPLAGCAGCPSVTFEEGPLSSLVILADDAAWARGLLERPQAAALVLELLAEPEALGSRFLHFEPGKVWLQARPTGSGIARAGEWLRALAGLAAECEAVPAGP